MFVRSKLIFVSLQLGEDSLGTRLLDAGTVLDGGVGDLAVVDDDGVAGGALALDPANALAELGLGVTSEELAAVSLPKQKIWGVERGKKKKKKRKEKNSR